VNAYPVQPGAKVLWCLRRRKTDVRCVIFASHVQVEVRVVQDTDLVLTETFQEEWVALNWAKVYGERLKEQGYYDSPGG
jgi:ABC-type Na+ transport system ATPase subunit NatA